MKLLKIGVKLLNNLLKLKALKVSYNDKDLYISKAFAKDIAKIAKVTRADQEGGYQRHLEKNRLKSISTYINDGNVIPGSIILSYQNLETLEYNPQSLELKLNGDLFILDGQHRLFGAAESDIDVELNINIICNLTSKEEIQYFLDINSNQKGVSKTLQKELAKYLLVDEYSIDAIRYELFEKFFNQDDSALFGRLTKITSSTGKLSHVPFEKAINPLLSNQVGYLSKFSTIDEKYRLLNTYLNIFSDILNSSVGSDRLLSTAAFFEAIFKIFDDVCALSIIYFRNLKKESLNLILECLNNFDFSSYTGTNQATIIKLSADMIDMIKAYSTRLHIDVNLLD